MILEIGWQLVLDRDCVRVRDVFTSGPHHVLLLYVSLSSGTRTSTGATFPMIVPQG